MSNVLNSDDLIASIKRRGSIPTSQKMFSEDDFLDIINEELNTTICPFVLEQNEEFFVVHEDQSLTSSTTNYPIPYRSIGNKLRDVALVDASNNILEMSRVSLEELSEYSDNIGSIKNIKRFYIKDDSVVPVGSIDTGDSLRLFFYLQPNKVVSTEDCGTVTSINKNEEGTKTFTNNDVAASTDRITISSHGYSTATPVRLSSDNTVPTGLSETLYFTIIVDSDTIKLATSAANASAGTAVDITGTTGASTVSHSLIAATQITLSTYPEVFPTSVTSQKYDFIGSKSPCKIRGYDETPIAVDSSGKFISFDTSDIPSTLEVGDYVCLAQQSPVPQIPVELHPLLAQACVIQCMEARNDTEGLNNAKAKFNEMKKNLTRSIDNRTEGAPKKILNRHSTLRNQNTRRRW